MDVFVRLQLRPSTFETHEVSTGARGFSTNDINTAVPHERRSPMALTNGDDAMTVCVAEGISTHV